VVTRRERYIADVNRAKELKAAGMSTARIAYRLDKSVRTIRDYLKDSALTTRLGVMDRDNEKKRQERKMSDG
jgi:DNA-binding NarL/FixJ family response regulator